MRAMAVAAGGAAAGAGALVAMATSPVDGGTVDWASDAYLYYAVYRTATGRSQHIYNGTESYEWLQEEVRRGEIVCNKEVASLGTFSSRLTCDGPTSDYNSEMTILFKLYRDTRVRMRMALNFGYGGALYLNGTLLEGKVGNLWWSGWWLNPDVFNVDLSLAAGEYELKALGFEPCCDGYSHVQYLLGDALTDSNPDRSDGSWQDLVRSSFDQALGATAKTPRLASQAFQNEVYIDQIPYPQSAWSLYCLQASVSDPERVFLTNGCHTDEGFDYHKRWLANKDGTIRNVLRSADGSAYACLAPTGGSAVIEAVLQLDVCEPGSQAQQWDWDSAEYRVKSRQNPALCITYGPTVDGNSQLMLGTCPSAGNTGEGLQLNMYKMWCVNGGTHIRPEEGVIDQVFDSVCSCPLHYIGNACELSRPVACTTTVETSVPYDCDRGRREYPEYDWSRDSDYPPCRIVGSEVDGIEVQTVVECGWDLNSNHTLYPIVNTSQIMAGVNWTYWLVKENGTLAIGSDPGLAVRYKVFDFYRLGNDNFTGGRPLTAEHLLASAPWTATINTTAIPGAFYIDGRLYSEFGLSDIPPGAATRGNARYVFDFPHRRADTRAPPIDLVPLWITLGVLGALTILAVWFIRGRVNTWLMQRPVRTEAKAGGVPPGAGGQAYRVLPSTARDSSGGSGSDAAESPQSSMDAQAMLFAPAPVGVPARRRPRPPGQGHGL